MLMKTKYLAMGALLGLGLLVQARADDIQFTTLPDVVRTTVVREANIPDYSRVTRVIRDRSGVYAVTVRRDTDNYVVYVDETGRVVRAQTIATPVQASPYSQIQTGQVVTQTTVAEQPTVETFVRSLGDSKYQLIEKKGNKEIYRDRTTGVRWVVRVEREDD